MQKLRSHLDSITKPTPGSQAYWLLINRCEFSDVWGLRM